MELLLHYTQQLPLLTFENLYWLQIIRVANYKTFPQDDTSSIWVEEVGDAVSLGKCSQTRTANHTWCSCFSPNLRTAILFENAWSSSSYPLARLGLVARQRCCISFRWFGCIHQFPSWSAAVSLGCGRIVGGQFWRPVLFHPVYVIAPLSSILFYSGVLKGRYKNTCCNYGKIHSYAPVNTF